MHSQSLSFLPLNMNKKSIALVLSSGGARGIAHIGVIAELERRGYQISAMSGTSMGALVGGLYASGSLGLYKEWLLSLDRMDVFGLVDFTLRANGLVKGEKVLREMKKIIPDKKIEDFALPFAAVATDITNGQEVVLKEGSLYDAIRASISIPTVFIPFENNGIQMVDGGVLNPIPINHVERKPQDILVVVDVNAHIPYFSKTNKLELAEEKKLKNDQRFKKYIYLLSGKLNSFVPKNENDKLGYFNLINKTMSLMVHQLSLMAIEKGKPDLLINIPHQSFGLFDFYKAAAIIKMGEEIAAKALDEYEKLE